MVGRIGIGQRSSARRLDETGHHEAGKKGGDRDGHWRASGKRFRVLVEFGETALFDRGAKMFETIGSAVEESTDVRLCLEGLTRFPN